MFAANRSSRDEKPAERGGDASDDDDWLRVGRSFKPTTAENGDKPNGEAFGERALQVYMKPSKYSRKGSRSRRRDSRESSSDGEERESRRAKKLSWKGKKSRKEKREKKERKKSSRRRYDSDSASDRSSRDSNDSDRRRKRKRARDISSPEADRRGSSSVVSRHHQQRSTGQDSSDLVLLASPTHGELEVYRDRHKVGLNQEKLFEFDCVGDRDNSFYGTLYTHEQPLYRLATRRSIVDGSWIVARPSQTQRIQQQEAKTSDKVDDGRYFGSAAKRVARQIGTKRLHVAYSQRRMARAQRVADGGVRDELLFIPLDAIVEGELDGVVEDEHGDADEHRPSGSETALWQTDLENVEQYLVGKQRRLNERVNTNPHDIDAWLDVIAFQDQSLKLAVKRKSSESSGGTAVVLDKQKAVLAKALEKNPSSRRLRLVQLNLLWREHHAKASDSDVDSYRALVETLLEKDPTNADLWMKLIQSAQQKFATFSATMLRDLYARVIAVLNKALRQLIITEKPTFSKSSRASTSFVHVVGTNSLLGAPDPYELDHLSERVAALSTSLLRFHQLMIRAEISTGYTERAVTQLQALIEINSIRDPTATLVSSEAPSEQLLNRFGETWNEEFCRFGEYSSDTEIQIENSPPSTALESFYANVMRETFERVNPPSAIRSPEHSKALLGACFDSESGANGLDDEGRDDETSAFPASRPRGQWVYSNLHGERIWIADADESGEYERILNELRGSESFQNRQEVRERKRESGKQRRLSTIAKLRDQRADFPLVNLAADEHLRWLAQETRAEMTQWSPLRTTNPEHTQFIEDQPDRAIMTEEILPFVFRVPRALHLQVVLNLLDVLGVRPVNFAGDAKPLLHSIGSDDFEAFGTLTTPILAAFEPGITPSVALSSKTRCELLAKALQRHAEVAQVTVADLSRVQFIRNVFTSALKYFSPQSGTKARLLKVLWMEFEFEVIVQTSDTSRRVDGFRSFCQGLLKSVGDAGSSHVDAWLLSAYATMELFLGNDRHAVRSCDKALASLQLGDSIASSSEPRCFHRLIYVRVQQTLKDPSLGTLRSFYFLWHVWRSESSESLEDLVKKLRKTPAALEATLRSHTMEYRDEVIERYRFELQAALEQCRMLKGASTCEPRLPCSVAFALSNLCTAVYVSRGFLAALQEYDHFLQDPSSAKFACHHRQCWIALLSFLQSHQASARIPILSPREWRRNVGGAVSQFPLDPLFLRLFVDAETSNTMSQTLRKHFQSRRQAWQRSLDSPNIVEWLFALLCEVARAERGGVKFTSHQHADATSYSLPTCCVLHRWGMSRPTVERIRRVFEELLGEMKTRGSAIGWRLYLRFEIAVGNVEAARKVFYRGLANCPWSKSLYLDAFRVLRPYLSDSECWEIFDFMAAKELHIRIDI